MLSACVQINSLQTAKTLPKGETTIGLFPSGYAVSHIDNFDAFLDIYAIMPSLQFFARRGITNKFDVGLKASTFANIAIDGKYQLLGNANSKFAMAVGIGFEYQFTFDNFFVCRQTASTYFSFHPKNDMAFYASSKFTHHSVINRIFKIYPNNTIFVGGNLGFRKRVNSFMSLIIEGSNFYVLDKNFNATDEIIYQLGIGLDFDLK